MGLFALQVASPAPQPAGDVLSTDSPRTTVTGNTFIAPARWRISVRDHATILEPPEGSSSHIALIDVRAKDAGSAVAAAWVEYGELKWPQLNTNDLPDKDGWSGGRVYNYQTSPNEKRDVQGGRAQGE
jgi:hypothetical protein